MNETKEKTVPVRKTSPGPAGLDGVEISGCAFTESVSKRELRPPLANVIYKGTDQVTGDVSLNLPNGTWVYARIVDWESSTQGMPTEYDRVYPRDPGAKRNPYTGPISPAMWARIRKWWQP